MSSWQVKNKQKIKIITGDGETYIFTWTPNTIKQTYNYSAQEYINTRGTYIEKTEEKGKELNIVLYVTGENHLDESNNFLESAADKHHWHIEHPYYGNLRVQPISILVNHQKYNLSLIQIKCRETLAKGRPEGKRAPEGLSKENHIAVLELTSKNYNSLIGNLTMGDLAVIEKSLNIVKKEGLSVLDRIKDVVNFTEIIDTSLRIIGEIQTIERQVFNLAHKPLDLILSVQRAVNYLIAIPGTIERRINAYKNIFYDTIDAFNQLKRTIPNRSARELSRNEKVFVEAHLTAVISSSMMASFPSEINEDGSISVNGIQNEDSIQTANLDEDVPEESSIENNANNGTSYENKDSLEDTKEELIEIFKEYNRELEENTSDEILDTEDYSPNPEVYNNLSFIVDNTLGNLNNIDGTEDIEVQVLNEYDTNIFVLAHRYYGLQVGDETIDKFIATNDLTLDELLIIKKDRPISYFI